MQNRSFQGQNYCPSNYFQICSSRLNTSKDRFLTSTIAELDYSNRDSYSIIDFLFKYANFSISSIWLAEQAAVAHTALDGLTALAARLPIRRQPRHFSAFKFRYAIFTYFENSEKIGFFITSLSK